MLKKVLLNHFPLLYLFSIPLLHIIYNYLNKYHTVATEIMTTIDYAIPFIPQFIVPYIAWYFFMFYYLIYFYQKDRKIYYESLIVIIFGMIFCNLVYYFFQTTVPRPILIGNDFFVNLVRFIYTNDQPYNAFPSIHVMTTFVIIYGIYKSKINSLYNRYFVYLFGFLIIISTVFVKQHSVLDGFASIILVFLIFTFARKLALANFLLAKEKTLKPVFTLSEY